MVEINEKNENLNYTNENNVSFEVENELNQTKIDGAIVNEKLETKGLKLKKATKDRLNQLQSKFGDAETLISTLLNQYELIKIENDSKFADRKAEIEKFNYLLDSIKNSYLSSLDMASFLEEKYNEKFQNEIKSRENIIRSIQEDNNELKKLLKEREEELFIKNSELNKSKDNFSKINSLMDTLENEINDKSSQIQNLQKNINSLTDIIEQNKDIKEKYDSNQEAITDLQNKLNNYKILENDLLKSTKELDSVKVEMSVLKEDLKREREYSNSLNEKIHNLILMNSNETSRIKDQYLEEKKAIEAEKNKIIEENFQMISSLKDEIYSLKLEALKLNK